MGAIASQITSLTTVYSTIYSGADQRKHQSSSSLAFDGKSQVTGEFPAQMAGILETVSICWRHHVYDLIQAKIYPWAEYSWSIFLRFLKLPS